MNYPADKRLLEQTGQRGGLQVERDGRFRRASEQNVQEAVGRHEAEVELCLLGHRRFESDHLGRANERTRSLQ